MHLSLNDSKKAIQKLILSNNLEYAWIVAQMFYPAALDHLAMLLHLKCVESEAQAHQLGLKLLDYIKNKKVKSLLKLSYSLGNQDDDQ